HRPGVAGQVGPRHGEHLAQTLLIGRLLQPLGDVDPVQQRGERGNVLERERGAGNERAGGGCQGVIGGGHRPSLETPVCRRAQSCSYAACCSWIARSRARSSLRPRAKSTTPFFSWNTSVSCV